MDKNASGRVMVRIALVASALIWGASAFAQDVKVTLVGGEETPPVSTTAKGEGIITIGADKAVSGTIHTTGIEGVAAHIHLGAIGQSGPPIINLTKGANGDWTVPAGSKLTDDQLASFKAGDLYVNVHSPDHKAGEIRAQLKP